MQRLAAAALAIALFGATGIMSWTRVRADQPSVPFWEVLRPGDSLTVNPSSTPTPSASAEIASTRGWSNENLNDVHFVSDTVGYAVGDNGVVLETGDRGNTWGPSRLTLDDQPVGRLAGVFFTDVNHGVAVGQWTNADMGVDGTGVPRRNQALIVRTVDGGEHWEPADDSGLSANTNVQSPNLSLNAVSFPDELTGYAVGDTHLEADGNDHYTVLKTTDGGRTWALLSAPFSPSLSAQSLSSVSFADPNNGVAVGPFGSTSATQNRTLRTVDGGGSWSVAAPTPASSTTDRVPRSLNSVVLATSSGIGYAVGNGIQPNAQGTYSALRTANGFATTNAETAPHNLNGVSMARSGDQVVYAVGWNREDVNTNGSHSYVTLPAVVTRQASASTDAAWVTEPIENWGAYETREQPTFVRGHEFQLNKVSASPSGGTVVAVGNMGLMLRREVAGELPPDACVPTSVATTLENQGVTLPPGSVSPCNTPPPSPPPVQVGGPATPTPAPTPRPTPLPPQRLAPDCKDIPVPSAPSVSVSSNPEFPCLEAFNFKDPSGAVASTVDFVQIDPGLGQEGRAVTLTREGRVFLYDVTNFLQRGVPGFGSQFPESTKSYDGDITGAVTLADAGIDVDAQGAPLPAALDTANHILYVASSTKTGALITIRKVVALSLTGQFPPTAFDFGLGANALPPVIDFTHLAVDPSRGMLYAAGSEGSDLGQTVATRTPQHDTHIFAFEVELGADQIHVEPRWSTYVGQLCASTKQRSLRFFGVSRDGRRLSLGCAGTDFIFLGVGQVYPNGILTVNLPEGDPAMLQASNDPSITLNFEPVPGGGMGASFTSQRVTGDQAAGVLVWETGALALVWDINRSGWIGRVDYSQFSFNNPHFLGIDADHLRLYFDQGSGNLTLFEVLNPGSNGNERIGPVTPSCGVGCGVSTGLDRLFTSTGGATFGASAFDPSTRRLVVFGDAGQARSYAFVLEDGIDPPLDYQSANPDDVTHDIPEDEAVVVDRFGQTSAYGARLWSTGLIGALPGSYAVSGTQDNANQNPNGDPFNPPPPPGATYNWLWTAGAHSKYTTQVPEGWRPYDSQREVFSSRVGQASLESESSAEFGSSEMSTAEARGLAADDGTNGDVHSRRGTAEWRSELPTQWEGLCSNNFNNSQQCKDQWDATYKPQWDDFYYNGNFNGKNYIPGGIDGPASEFDACAAHADDVALSALDGRASSTKCKETAPAEQQPPGDEVEPSRSPTPTSGVEQDAGFPERSRCDNPGGQQEAETGGSSVTCELNDPDQLTNPSHTSARAGNSIFVPLPGGASLGISATQAETNVTRDAAKGLVSTSKASVSGVQVAVAGLGILRIGEVETTATAWANGRPDGAHSEYHVTYHNVTVTDQSDSTGPGESERTILACKDGQAHSPLDAAHGTQNADSASTVSDAASKGCDPAQIDAVLLEVFGGRVRIAAPARDEADRRVTGSPGGRQAFVRRNRTDYLSDYVLFQVDRQEVPGLELTISDDGTLANRYRADLAGVFAATSYSIGEAVTKVSELPATLGIGLADPDGKPLAGGTFQVLKDVDGDGMPTNGDQVAAHCTTGIDGLGDCAALSLEAGDYLVVEETAPPGYFREQKPTRFQAEAGRADKVLFVNVREAGSAKIFLTDPSHNPLKGGRFEVGGGPSGGGSCTTDATGKCEISPLARGRYTVSEATAPSGFVAAKPVQFDLTLPGQVALIDVVNGRSGTRGTIGRPGTPGTASSSSTMDVVTTDPSQLVKAVRSDASGGGLFRRIGRGLAQAIARNPMQAIGFGLLLLIAAAPGYLLARRRELSAMRELT